VSCIVKLRADRCSVILYYETTSSVLVQSRMYRTRTRRFLVEVDGPLHYFLLALYPTNAVLDSRASGSDCSVDALPLQPLALTTCTHTY